MKNHKDVYATDCPVCAIKARMVNPDGNPTCGHKDYPADRLIDLILKYIPRGPHPVWNRSEEVAICSVISTWCGRSERRRFMNLRLCAACYEKHVGLSFSDGWLLNSALPDADAIGFGDKQLGGVN
ncbi:hypothetical protein CGCSCA4_v014577 [Colletotrichum siamense]|uniref:Uncharacterized protein n=1 Tax=Colletotrichum siamense TaxID=690259 RepID=A0A9P5BSU4_COLSI|nr:hypothetical protein CGCSCA4_v014577 [Colletotrichum siamense]KAF4842563.1 hypothetical protein CGCSCA2_v014521 [Colletotrichum siamense]